MPNTTQPLSTCTGVISVNDTFYHHRLFFNTDDRVEVFLSDEKSIGLVYTSDSLILYNGNTIGQVRYPYPDEEKQTMKMVLHLNGKENVIVDSDIDAKGPEAFIEAELVFTEHLIENMIVTG